MTTVQNATNLVTADKSVKVLDDQKVPSNNAIISEDEEETDTNKQE